MSVTEILRRADKLREEATPFVLATVVRAESPTSARAGDRALVLADGTVEGFVGGICAEATVRVEGLRLLRDRASSLLRIVPADAATGSSDEDREGLITVDNPCLSGGTIEVFLEAVVPPTVVHVHGDAPVARALARIGEAMDYQVHTAEGDPLTSAVAVVVASHGRDEAEVLTAALRARVPYVALVASRARGRAVLDALDVEPTERARVHTPAGLDLGATTPAEIALSIYAEMVGTRERVAAPSTRGLLPGKASGPVLDPVCGMTVSGTAADPSVVVDGVTWWFCGSGCRRAFVDDPVSFAPAAAAPAGRS